MHIKTKLISTAAFVMGSWMLAAPAYATCGVNGYWGSECGPQTPEPAPTTPGDITNTLTGGNSSSTATGVGVGVGVGTGGNGYGGQGGAGGSSTATATGTGGQGGAGGQGGRGGSATATGGSVTGSGNSSSDSSAVAGVTGSGNSSSTSGVRGSGNSRVTNSTTVNNTNKTRIKHAASTAAPVMMGGYGPGNCFGDTNPSGQFGASIQTFGWGVTANRSKANNLCAMVAIAGPNAALSYLANVDPNVRRALLANGLAEKPSQRKARIAAEAEAQAGTPKNARPAQTVRCPEGSVWNGKGCWAADLRKVRR